MRATVGEIADQIRGVTYAKSDASDTPKPDLTPILRANNITDAGLQFDDLVYVPDSKIGRRQTLEKGDVVIAASSGSIDVVGKAAPFQAEFQGSFGAFCKVLRPNLTRVDPSYFSHFFRTEAYRQTISRLAAGANINNLKNEHLDNLEIPLPPLPEQRRIATILDKADALRRKRKRGIELLDGITQSLVSTTLLSGPKEALGELILDGPTNGLYKPSSAYGQGVPILRINNFYDGKISDLAGLRRLSVSPVELERYELATGDIVVNRVNSLEYLGKSALVEHLEEPTVYESNMMRFRVNLDRMLPEVCIALLQTRDVKRQILGKAKNAVNQSSINQGDVKDIQLPLAPMEAQRTFRQATRAIQAARTRLHGGLSASSTLFASLQSRAFSGQL